MSRNPRSGGLTKTQQLRQARSAALVKDLQKKEISKLPEEFKVRRKYVRPEPKKVDFRKPGMTKAMIARMKQAEKFKQEYERKQETVTSARVPRRTPAPVGGDARMGRERTMGKRTPAASPTRAPTVRAGPSLPPKKGVTRWSPKVTEDSVPKKTAELAKMMNAEVIQAEPITDGPISSIVIPAGTVSGDRTAIVTLPQPTETRAVSQVANRSIQVISETLDEQDAVESAAVQGKLTELQQARREFVIAVANVGGNAVQLEDISAPSFTPDSPMPAVKTPPKALYRIPDVEDEYLKIEYGKDHPVMTDVREYLQKIRTENEAKEAARRMEEEFASIAAADVAESLQLEVEEEPWKEEFYQYEPFDPEELEKFFDVQRYPPQHCPQCGPPAGREDLHPDLWELDDPWYRRPLQPDEDLIEFEHSDLIKFD